MIFLFLFILSQFCSVLIWILLGVYVKENYGISEQYYGWIPTTNALMVVFLQMAVSRLSRRFQTLPVLTFGAVLYTLAVTSVAWGSGFWHFWISIVIMTLGEMLLMPTSSTYVANLAPPEKRGRYMSLYSLNWGVASGIAPLMGGFLNDRLDPRMIWYGGGAIGIISVIGFFLFTVFQMKKEKQLRDSSVPQ
jgi:MFS family permease